MYRQYLVWWGQETLLQQICNTTGASILNLVAVMPNPGRCGAFPANVELHFEGEGTDTVGGPFTAVSSACQDTATNEVFDLQAGDTYVLSGDTLAISSAPFILAPNPETCVAAHAKPVKFSIAGGTGAFANATGGGKYNLFATDPGCSGVNLPSLVSFEGKIKF